MVAFLQANYYEKDSPPLHRRFCYLHIGRVSTCPRERLLGRLLRLLSTFVLCLRSGLQLWLRLFLRQLQSSAILSADPLLFTLSTVSSFGGRVAQLGGKWVLIRFRLSHESWAIAPVSSRLALMALAKVKIPSPNRRFCRDFNFS